LIGIGALGLAGAAILAVNNHEEER